MKIGKIEIDGLEQIVLNKINKRRDDVLLHAGIGEDCAVVDFGEDVLVMSSDPITGATKDAGYLAVHVACNDLAATGAKPVGIQVVLLLPTATTDQQISDLMTEIDDTASELNVEILGGHTEILSSVSKPLIVISAVGKAKKDEYVPTGGARPGDDLILTKGVGIEGSYILASDYEQLLLKKGVNEETIYKLKEYKTKLSVLPEGLIAAEFGVHAMHDVTEGGLYGALDEMARASKMGFEIWSDCLKPSAEVKEIAEMLKIDPAGLLSSGSMLIACSEGKQLIDRLKEEGIKSFPIGKMSKRGKYLRNSEGKIIDFEWNGKDELWRLMDEGLGLSSSS